jgi:hypothetical protein
VGNRAMSLKAAILGLAGGLACWAVILAGVQAVL